jgi:glycosyltransferase involved in cell wall biosynthesis
VVLAVPVLETGYGVATVASAQERILREAGYQVRMVALRAPKVPTSRILRASPIPWGFSDICRSLGAGLVVVHGPPFLGFSPEPGFHPVHWEHGMVFPEVLSGPYATRAAGALAQRERQCREAELVVCPSRTLAQRLNLPLARVIPNGADQLPLVAVGQDPSPRILLAVLRTGTVEDQYKGLGDLIELPSRLGSGQPWKLRVVLTGSGGAEHRLRNAGWEVFRDVTGPELARQYAEASVYLAPSRCESFDLPLVEAQRAGAAGLAFAGSAHPETCPHLYTSVVQAAKILEGWNAGGLETAMERSRILAEPFTWANHGRELLSLVRERLVAPLPPSAASRARAVFWRLWWAGGSIAYGLGRRWLR